MIKFCSEEKKITFLLLGTESLERAVGAVGKYELQCAIDVESGVREKTMEVSPSRKALC